MSSHCGQSFRSFSCAHRASLSSGSVVSDALTPLSYHSMGLKMSEKLNTGRANNPMPLFLQISTVDGNV